MCAARAGRPLPRFVQKAALLRKTCSGRMRPVPRLHTHMLREAVPSGIRTQLRQKPAPRCPKAGRHRCPSACRPKKRHALPMPLPSAVTKAPPSGRLASPTRRASQKATPAESQLSAQNKRRAPLLPLEPGAKKRLAALFRSFLFAKRGRSPFRSLHIGEALPFMLTLS